jgi:hypothetical protein
LDGQLLDRRQQPLVAWATVEIQELDGQAKILRPESSLAVAAIRTRAHTCRMVIWLLVAVLTAVTVLAVTGVLEVRRFSRTHLTAKLAIRRRGIFISRTPDGTWWRVRLRPARCEWTPPMDFGDAPPDSGVREPRRPLGPGPAAGTISLDPPR